MKKTKVNAPAPPAPKPSYDPPYEFAGNLPSAPQGSGTQLRHLTTAEVGKVELDPPRMTPPRRGPSSADRAMTDAQFVSQSASAEEMKRFRGEIEARQARDPGTWIWQRCDNPRCRLAMRVKPTSPEGDCCPKCNLRRRQDLGHMFRMDDRAVNEHLFEMAKKNQEDDERALRARWTARNQDRAKSGLEPLTLEAYRREAKVEFEKMMARSRDIGEVAAACRQNRRRP